MGEAVVEASLKGGTIFLALLPGARSRSCAEVAVARKGRLCTLERAVYSTTACGVPTLVLGT
eukprot:1297229-Alexandrium_andersonii.AAC.2